MKQENEQQTYVETGTIEEIPLILFLEEHKLLGKLFMDNSWVKEQCKLLNIKVTHPDAKEKAKGTTPYTLSNGIHKTQLSKHISGSGQIVIEDDAWGVSVSEFNKAILYLLTEKDVHACVPSSHATDLKGADLAAWEHKVSGQAIKRYIKDNVTVLSEEDMELVLAVEAGDDED